ncbi:uncharacterized protein [Diabrotica undecimpunctata]|uniref:uncharacterized protein n=1 Tax=Diabrotica undecimpunctata TaxID=50387 RepID=UPI003B6413E8
MVLFRMHCGLLNPAKVETTMRRWMGSHLKVGSKIFYQHWKKNALIVTDNAPYHSRKLEKIPIMATKKTDIQNWLRSKNIFFEETLLKVQLLEIGKQHKTVLRLPPYHWELNQIELVWTQVKNYVTANNTTFKLADIKNLFPQAISAVTI